MRRFSVPLPKKGPTYYNKDSSYEELYIEYWDTIRKFAYGASGDYHRAEDVAQEVMCQIFKRWDWIQWEKLPAAIAVITHNTIIDMHRADKGNSSLILFEDELTFECHDSGLSDPIRSVLQRESLGGVKMMYSCLNEQETELFDDMYSIGLSVKEVMAKHKISRGAVYLRLHRLRSRLIDYMVTHDVEYRW